MAIPFRSVPPVGSPEPEQPLETKSCSACHKKQREIAMLEARVMDLETQIGRYRKAVQREATHYEDRRIHHGKVR